MTLLTINGTWVYHHKRMCCIHSWSRFDVDLWLQGQIYRLLSCLHVRPVTSVSFDIGIPYLAHWSITMRGCVIYWMILIRQWPLSSRLIYRVYDMTLCSGLSFFVLWHNHTLFDMWVYHHGRMCRVHSWTLYDLGLWPQYQNYIFNTDLSLAKCFFSLI